MRTLVIHLGGIGDFLLACPALVQLRRDGPIELVGVRERIELAVGGGIADAAHDQDQVELGSIFSTPSPRLRAFLGGFDRCIALMRPDDAMVETIRGCGVRRVVAFPGLPPSGWTRHASIYYLECLGLDDPGPVRLAFDNVGDASPDADVVIHPGSGGRNKNWPIADYARLSEELKRRGRCVTWCIGPAEEQMTGPQPILPPMRLERLARALARTRLYIGNDSGITHLAAATGAPTVAIFGPTDPAIWAPRGENVRVVGGNGQGFPTFDQVLESVLRQTA